MFLDAAKIARAMMHVISDSGATGYFLVRSANATNLQPTNNPIHTTLPNGKTIYSTHTCNLNIPWLGHIISSLAHSSLISTRNFCDHGCKVVFNLHECRVYYKDELVLRGARNKQTDLWNLPIDATRKPASNTLHGLNLAVTPTRMQEVSIEHYAANSVYTLPYKQQQINTYIKPFSTYPSKPL